MRRPNRDRPGDGRPSRRHGQPERDPWQDPRAKRWIRNVLSDMEPKIADSAIVAMLLPRDAEGDVKFWVELGASIMYDKPIIAIVQGDRDLPPKLARVADEILRLPDGDLGEEARDAVEAAIERMIGDEGAAE